MEFAIIFTEMSWIAALLLITGAVFVVIELFVPGFGFFGVTGILSLIAGVIVRIIGGLNPVQSITLVLLVLGFFALAGMVMVFSAQYGTLGRSGLFERRTTLDKDYNKTDKKLKKLVGKSGKAITMLNLAGKAKIRGKVYEVLSTGSFIESGANIKVVKIEDNTIMVRKWFE
ncbi:MAG: hypothetical protein E7351_00915 [Clostridiales bacterium]|nr:hypothetical protein [Clostridiales bacterium]